MGPRTKEWVGEQGWGTEKLESETENPIVSGQLESMTDNRRDGMENWRMGLRTRE